MTENNLSNMENKSPMSREEIEAIEKYCEKLGIAPITLIEVYQSNLERIFKEADESPSALPNDEQTLEEILYKIIKPEAKDMQTQFQDLKDELPQLEKILKAMQEYANLILSQRTEEMEGLIKTIELLEKETSELTFQLRDSVNLNIQLQAKNKEMELALQEIKECVQPPGVPNLTWIENRIEQALKP